MIDMKNKKIVMAFFSATGTTEKIVKRVGERMAAELQLETQIVDFTPAHIRQADATFGENDIMIFGTPVYAGRVPNVLLPYLREKIHGNGTLAVPIVLYGNRNYDDGLIELREILSDAGVQSFAAGAFVGEHAFSYVLAANRPDRQDMAQADALAEIAVQRLRSGEVKVPVFVKGELPLRPYYTPRDRKGAPVNILKVKPKTDEKCDKCGICAAACPMGSIAAANPAEISGICIKCGACVKKCPLGAKYYDDEKYIYHKTELEEGYTRRAEPELF